MVISGDFNLGKIPWETPESTKGVNELAFVEALNDHYLTQLNHTPTRGDSILDLVITSTPEHTSVTEVLSLKKAGIFTDHRTILFEHAAFIKAPAKFQRSVLDYELGDFDGLRAALLTINLSSYLDHEDINADWQEWKELFLAAVSDYIPSKRLKGRNLVPWMNGTILNLIRKKSAIRQKMKKSPTDHLNEKFKKLRSEIKRMLREQRDHFFGAIESDVITNPKRFWSILKHNSKSRNIPNLVSMATTTNSTAGPDSQARTTVFSPGDSHEAPTPPPDESCMTELSLTVPEVQSILERLDVTKATGPDGISARLLKETASVIAPSLCKLNNKSLSLGVLPQEWKEANVVPVFEKDKAEFTENYRPISLLSLISKVLERCVLNSFCDRLIEFVKACQHGFLQGKSCTS